MPSRNRVRTVPSGFQSKSTSALPTSSLLDNSESPPGEGHDQNAGQEPFLSDGFDSDDSHSAPPTSRPLHSSQSQTHLAPHGSAFFPPFYNRPPTPLPPSPSLTSLLRPTFSTASRPSTPDSSDVDAPGSSTATSATANLASITKSAQHAPTVPRAAPKIPTYEYYGFAVYLASSAAFLLYLVWAYVPSPLLHQMGIHYYPNRWWALAVPCWLVALVVYIYVALAGYNTRHITLPLNSCENLVDNCAQVAIIDRRTGKIAGNDGRDSPPAYEFGPSEHVDWKAYWSISTDGVMDVPIGGVCEVLYGEDSE